MYYCIHVFSLIQLSNSAPSSSPPVQPLQQVPSNVTASSPSHSQVLSPVVLKDSNKKPKDVMPSYKDAMELDEWKTFRKRKEPSEPRVPNRRFNTSQILSSPSVPQKSCSLQQRSVPPLLVQVKVLNLLLMIQEFSESPSP